MDMDEEETRFGRRRCKLGRPYDGLSGRWYHPEARQIGEQRDGYPGGDLADFRCPICRHEWTEELPQ